MNKDVCGEIDVKLEEIDVKLEKEEEKLLEARVKEEEAETEKEPPHLNDTQFSKLDELLTKTQLYSDFLLEKMDDITLVNFLHFSS